MQSKRKKTGSRLGSLEKDLREKEGFILSELMYAGEVLHEQKRKRKRKGMQRRSVMRSIVITESRKNLPSSLQRNSEKFVLAFGIDTSSDGG